MSVRSFSIHLFVRDVIEVGGWYEKVLSARISDIMGYGNGNRYVEIRFGTFNIILDERQRFTEQNLPLSNRFMQIDVEVSRVLIDRLDKFSLDVEEDYISDERDARWVTIRDPDDNKLHFVCYSDF